MGALSFFLLLSVMVSYLRVGLWCVRDRLRTSAVTKNAKNFEEGIGIVGTCFF